MPAVLSWYQSNIAFPHDFVIILNPEYLFYHFRMLAFDTCKLRRCIISDPFGKYLSLAPYLDNIPAVKHPRDLDNTRRQKPHTFFNRILCAFITVSYTHLRAHETRHDLVCRLLLE